MLKSWSMNEFSHDPGVLPPFLLWGVGPAPSGSARLQAARGLFSPGSAYQADFF